jgi:hypothetical protein
LDASSIGDSLVLGHNWNIHTLMGKYGIFPSRYWKVWNIWNIQILIELNTGVQFGIYFKQMQTHFFLQRNYGKMIVPTSPHWGVNREVINDDALR